MSKWIKFRDKLPNLNSCIWVSDGKTIWATSGWHSDSTNLELYWMDRINPELPKKEFHECVFTQYGQRFKCFNSDNVLLLTLHDKTTDLNKTDIDNFLCTVKFCPFCGFTLGDK